MLEQTVEVVTAAPDGIWVRAVEPSGCGSCGGQGCSSRRIAELFQRKPRVFPVECDLALAPGDRVIVGIADGSVLAGAARAYGTPLACMLGGAVLGQAVQPGDGAALAGLLVGAVVGSVASRGARAARPRVLRREDPSVMLLKKGKSS